MKSRSVIHVLVLLLALPGAGQSSNDWINANQQYFKLKVTEDGWYRVTNTELVSAGVPISTINPTRVQLFRRGVEVAILTENSSGLLTAFEFYGQKNDGKGDTELYSLASDQPNDRYSLFTDTAAYFLTWSSTLTGKRIQFNSDQAKTVPVSTYYLKKNYIQQVGVYSEGQKYGEGNELSSGTFGAGEGWTGNAIGKTGTQAFTFDLTGKVTSAEKPSVSVLLAGGNNQDHNVEISVGPSVSSQRILGAATFTGYTTRLFTAAFEWTDVGAANELVVVVRAVGFTGVEERISVSYVEVTNPRQYSLTGTTDERYDLPTTTNDRYYLSIPTTAASSLKVYNITSPATPVRHATSAFSDRVEIVLGSAVRQFLVVSSAPRKVHSIKPAITTKLSPATANYLIITHPLLRKPANDGLDPVAAYEAYRSSASGGSFNVYTASIKDIYDQFAYGDPSPLAIRNYLTYALSTATVKHLLLIGKGLNLTYHYGRTNDLPLPHFVPTFGYPGSDALFAAKIGGSDVPKIPVGRIGAQSPEDVRLYLSKVKEMEALPFNALWRKNLIHLSGGQNPFELSSFYATVNNLKTVAEGDFLGGKVSIKRKESTDPVESINVTSQINSGVSMITFFGHSGSFTQDVEIGNPAKAHNHDFTNRAKYPVLLMNGCNSGSIFDSNDSYIDDWVMAENLGAIAGIAHVDLATSSNLRRFSYLFYENAFAKDTTFGSTLGAIYQQTQEDYFAIYGNSLNNESQVYGMLLIGDPAIKLFGADKPDYAVTDADVYVSTDPEERPLATSESFPLFIVVRNYGRTVLDQLTVKVDRMLPDGTILSYEQLFDSPRYQDTLRFEIDNEAGNVYEGQNMFTISLDPASAISELSEGNNQSFFNLPLTRGNTLNLFPTDYGVVGANSTLLRFQSIDPLSEERAFSLEIDTVSSFSSSFLKSETLTGTLLSYDLSLTTFLDSTTVFWRTRFTEAAPTEDTTWVVSSFTFIRDATPGWAMMNDYQLSELDFTGISLDPATGQWAFNTSQVSFRVVVHGKDTTNYKYEDFQVIVDGNDRMITDLGPLANPLCRTEVMGALFFDRETALLKSPLGLIADEVNNPIVCGQQPQLIFNLSENDILGANRYLDSLISLLDTGDGMVLFSLGAVDFSNWDAQVKASLNQMGINTSTVDALVDGQPVIFFGRKGGATGSAIEIISNGTGLPLPDQELDYIGSYTGTTNSGSSKTGLIGPARQWTSFQYSVEESAGDQLTFNVLGVTPLGTETSLFSENRVGTIDISTVDASLYPHLKLRVDQRDLQNLTPPALRAVSVTYSPPADGMLVSPKKTNDALPEGQDYSRAFQFVNTSDQAFEDSVTVTFSLVNVTSGTPQVYQVKEKGPAAGDTLLLSASFQTVGKVGSNNLSILVQAQEAEQYLTNNQVTIANALVVEKDEVNPILDVTFDGSHILDGDIISPNPTIRIRLRDDNPFLYKSDTSGFSIFMKSSCETCVPERVSFSDPKLTYTPASAETDFEIHYQPGPLDDGNYTLQVQGRDESGNDSGANPYEISFIVINESTITRFFPYPNPFSTSTRFVFTLTGSEIPDQIKIQIMTVTGRVVREITQDEIGPIKIGQNITQYAWDGKDEYGDRLANGVYLYKVYIRQGGERINHRYTSADRAFKHGFGKIYLLR